MDKELVKKVTSFIDDWTRYGMTDMNGIKRWLDVGIWNAGVAYEFLKKGITSMQVARAVAALGDLGIKGYDSSYYIEHICSGDVPVDIIIKIAHIMNKLTMMLEIYEAPCPSDNEEYYTKPWYKRGFDLSDIDCWYSVGVWNSEVAAQLRQAEIGPADILRAERWLIKNSERDYPKGSPIWAACNGDIPVQVIIDAAKESLQRENDQKEKEMTASIEKA
jgi:predicted transcriptional regulator